MILNLMRRTPNDPDFVKRWEVVGKTYTTNGSYENKDIKILLIDHSIYLSEDMIQWYPNLKVVCTPNTSTEHIEVDLEKYGIKLIQLKLGDERLRSVDAVAQLCMRVIYTQARPYQGCGINLRDKYISVFGGGRIGMALGGLAEGNNMFVRYLDKKDTTDGIKNAFKWSDWISIHLPANDETFKLVDAEYLSLMKPSAFLINTSRASVLDEEFLLYMIQKKKIAGAHLDVTNLDLKHFGGTFTYSAHVAGSTTEDRIKTDEIILSDLIKEVKDLRL